MVYFLKIIWGFVCKEFEAKGPGIGYIEGDQDN
jgi:hypothetical protein